MARLANTGTYQGEASPGESHGPFIDRLLKRFEGPAASVAARQRRIDLLTRTIHNQVIPHIALTHRRYDTVPAGGLNPGVAWNDAELSNFTSLVLAGDMQTSLARLQELSSSGTSLPDICLSVLAPAARRLGEMWDDDLCSFVDVTAGLGTLHMLMHRLREFCGAALPVRDLSRHILVASLAGNQHTFGLQMVAEVFRHSGWDVTIETAAGAADLPDIVRDKRFAIAGLSIARDQQISTLSQTIRAIRQASLNRTIGILVGGPAVSARPELARLVGADLDASDGKQAVLRAEGLRHLVASLD